MKRVFIYIFLAAMAFSSCEKTGDISSPAIPQGYIMFSAGVDTKAALGQNMKECVPFGVMGYNYSKTTDWSTARVLETPDVFYNMNVDYYNGIYTYDDADTDLKSWNDVEKCSFFAYYPMASVSNNISISAQNALDVPTVTYTFPFPATTSDILSVPGHTKIHDLMTAAATDITSVGSGYVSLNFEHRLFCLEIVVRNYNNTPVTIRNMDLKLEGLKYTTAVIPLQKGDLKKSVTYSGTAPSETTFRITDSNEDITVPGYTDSQKNISFSISEKGSDKGGYIMLIPQEAGEVTGTVTWEGINDFDNVSNTFTSDFDYEEGKRYVIVINIAGESITIAIIEEESWNSKDVNIEFN